jgi:hypothetical protein
MVLCLALMGLLAACSSGPGRASSTTLAVQPSRHAAERVTASTLAGGVALPAGRGPSRPPSADGAPGGPDAAARAGFDTWLQALATGDTTTVLATSSGPAQALGAVALVVDEAFTADGASTSTTIGSESLSPSTVSAQEVDFSAQVVLDHTLSGPKGTTSSQDTIAGPVKVVSRSGSWQVEDLTYDGQALVLYTEGSSATVNGVTLVVAFVESLGNATVALVKLTASGPLPLDIDKVALTLASGAQITGTAQFGKAMSVGELDFARIPGAPALLDVTVRRGPGATPFDLQIALQGQPSSQ